MLISPDIYLKQCLSGYVLHDSLLHLLLKNSDFLNTDISQGSVATRLGCDGIFTYGFVTNFLLSLTVKEFWKSVNIWWSYGQELGVLFFLTHSVVHACGRRRGHLRSPQSAVVVFGWPWTERHTDTQTGGGRGRLEEAISAGCWCGRQRRINKTWLALACALIVDMTDEVIDLRSSP